MEALRCREGRGQTAHHKGNESVLEVGVLGSSPPAGGVFMSRLIKCLGSNCSSSTDKEGEEQR